jgi:predicted dehydrogenase
MRLAFIGGSGHHYLRRLVNDDAGTDLAVASDGYDHEAARSLVAGLPGARWFDHADTMLDRFRPDVVSVGAVYAHNGDFVAKTLERDIPTCSDKPIAATWEQYRRLIELTAGTDRRLVTEFNLRSGPAFRAARDAVARGLIGQVVLVTAQKSYKWGTRPAWYADPRHYPSTLLWIASHGIDAVTFTTGQGAVRVCGRQANLSRPDGGRAEDHAVAVLELDRGATALVHADYLRPAKAETHGDDRIRIAGSTGLVEVRDGRCILVSDTRQAQDITDQVSPKPVHRELLDALLGPPSDLYNTAASLATARILLHARDAADTFSVIDVTDDGMQTKGA